MKKLILGLAVTASSLVFAQTTTKEIVQSSSPVTFGVKGGLHILPYSGTKLGFNVGGFVNIPLSTKFSLQSELIYSDVKFNSITPIDKYAVLSSHTSNLGNISIPVMVQFNVSPKFYVEAGPEFSYLVKNNSKPTSEIYSAVAKPEFNKFNVKLGIGLGYYFTPNFGITARYLNGVTDTYKNVKNTKDDAFQIGVAYKFK